jgi:hypothetical protein
VEISDHSVIGLLALELVMKDFRLATHLRPTYEPADLVGQGALEQDTLVLSDSESGVALHEFGSAML